MLAKVLVIVFALNVNFWEVVHVHVATELSVGLVFITDELLKDQKHNFW